ncbi:MAG: hypothetical protein PHH22_03060 [Clostridia bacterium]|nr:hypothetical protein [Clostridia bacterium]
MSNITKEIAHNTSVTANQLRGKLTLIENSIERFSHQGYSGLSLQVNKPIMPGLIQILSVEDINQIKEYFEGKGFDVSVKKTLFSKKPNYVIINW